MCIIFCWNRKLFNTTLIGSVAFGRWELCTCTIFCWIRELFNTTLTSPVAFGIRELCVLVLHSAGSDSYLTLLWLVPWHLVVDNYVYLYYILLDQKLFSTTLIGPVAFGIRELCVLVWHSAGPDSYLTLLWLVPCHKEDGSYVCLYYILLDQRVISHFFDWSRNIWSTGVMCTFITFY
jgi:hypothetical protein